MKKFFNVSANLIGIISGVFGIIEFLHANVIIKICFYSITLFFIILFFYRLVMYIKNYFNAEIYYFNKLKEVSEHLHKFSHNIRDINGCKNKDIAYREYFINLCKNICNDIQPVISNVLDDQKVSVSIKKISTKEIIDTDYKNWTVSTIARCSRSNQNRNRYNSPKKISENSYLEIIVSPDYEDTAFISTNLTNEIDFFQVYKIPYKNTTHNYLNYYKSTIVVPIRIIASKVSPEIGTLPSQLDYYVIGFLCIDSLKTYENNIDLFKIAANLTKAMADELYSIFEKNIIISLKGDNND